MRPINLPIDLAAWIDEHRDLLQPPVGNAQIWADGDFIVTVVGGPNQRTDFHDDPCEEFFYQLQGRHGPAGRGRTAGRVTSPSARASLPAAAPTCGTRRSGRCPARSAWSSSGQRPAGMVDGFEWYCPRCHALVHRGEVQLASLVDDLPKAFAAFYDDEAARTCPSCGWVHPGRGALPDPPLPPTALPRQERDVTVVDLHSHFFPETWPDLAERFGTPDWPWMRRDGADRAMVMLGDREFRPDHLGLLGRRRAPGRHGPRRRRPARSSRPTPVLFAYGRPAEHAMECARIFNDALLELCAPAAAGSSRSARCRCRTPTWPAASWSAASPPGMKGVQIGNHVGDRDLDDEGIVTFLAHCASLGAPVFVHPWDMFGGCRLDDWMLRLDRRHAGRDPAVAEPR